MLALLRPKREHLLEARRFMDVNVAVIDGGIDVDHPDLKRGRRRRLRWRTWGVRRPRRARDHSRRLHRRQGQRHRPRRRGSRTPLWAVRVFTPGGSANASKIVCGIDWVTSTRLDTSASNDIAVGNMRFGFTIGDFDCASTDRKAALRLAVCRSIAVGVTYVAAAGIPAPTTRPMRRQPTTTCWPSPRWPTPTASREDWGRRSRPVARRRRTTLPRPSAAFAALPSDQAHTLAAPGVCLDSTFLDGGYGGGSVTSFSAPLVAGTVALCLTNQCSGLSPRQIVQKIVADARAYNEANPGYGFQGDPLRPISGKYYGYPIRAGLY
jgi:subtilisin